MFRPASLAAMALACACLVGFVQPARALSEGQILDKLAPILGLDPDQVSAYKFYIKNPACTEKVIQYTAAQDYSLAALIAALKVSKNEIAGLPKISLQQCKAANPIDNLWRFVQTEPANKLLGAGNAQLLRDALAPQIGSAKKQLTAQIEAIPYVGPILANWNCGCDFAFETNFETEKVVKQTSQDAIQLARYARSKNYDAMIEFIIEKWGASVGCKAAEDFVGTTKIPLLSGVIHKVCVGVVGTVAGWVSGSVTVPLQMLGILDSGKGMPPDSYYSMFMVTDSREPGYASVLAPLQNACFEYYRTTEMADSTAQKVCGQLAARYMAEGESNAQQNARIAELNAGWYDKNMGAVAIQAAMSTDADFLVRANLAQTDCETYFFTKYPKAPHTKQCEHWARNVMPTSREKAQQAVLDKARDAGKPFCSAGERNALVCTGVTYEACRKVLPANCAPGTLKGGKAFPCCLVGASDKLTQFHVEGAKKWAAQAGDYCRTRPQDPFVVECAIKEARDLLYQNNAKTAKFTPDCSQLPKPPTGVHEETCLAVVPGMLEEMQGVKELPGIIEAINKELGYAACLATSSVSAGKLRADDRRVAHCSPVGVEACRKKLPVECKKGPMGLVERACCDTDAFITDKQAYDPKKRSTAWLALVKQAQAKLAPGCHFATTAGSPAPDEFHLACENSNQLAQCQVALLDANRSKSACETAASMKTYLPSAYDSMVVTPCCSVKMDFGKPHASTPVVSTPAASTAPPKGLGSGSVVKPPGSPASLPVKPLGGTTSASPVPSGSSGIGKPAIASPGPSAFGAGTSKLAPPSGPLKPLIDAGCKASPSDPLAFKCPASAMQACHRLEREGKVRACAI